MNSPNVHSPGQELEEYIYKLTDPFTLEIRWIGRTTDPPSRLMQHLYQKTENAEKDTWIAGLRAQDAFPLMEIIETVTVGHPIEREKYWIKYYIGQGANLFNRAHNRKPRATIVGYSPEERRYKQQIAWFQQLLFTLPHDLGALERFVFLSLIALCNGEEKPYKLQIGRIVKVTSVDYSTLTDKTSNGREGILCRLHNLGLITYARENKQTTIITG